MGFVRDYAVHAPERSAIDAQPGLQLLEFGTGWCGHCRAAQPLLQQVLGGYPALDYYKIEDGKGRPLGRSFKVTLWPTVILLRDGQEARTRGAAAGPRRLARDAGGAGRHYRRTLIVHA